MALIYETDNFTIESADRPFVDRTEGGHLRIYPKVPVRDRTKLTPALAIEYTKLSMAVGEALVTTMRKQGIEIGIVNYQDMGNWGVFKPEGPTLHMQIFGRAVNASIQKYGDAVLLPQRETGFYNDFKPLTEEDCELLKIEIGNLLNTEKYSTRWSE
ncbi:MAG: hypothetical protein WC030_02925 [Candidatus Paceibacterota bacterium]